MTVKEIKKSIDKLYSDTSVPPQKTMDRFKDIREHIEVLIESVNSDLQMQEEDE